MAIKEEKTNGSATYCHEYYTWYCFIKLFWTYEFSVNSPFYLHCPNNLSVI